MQEGNNLLDHVKIIKVLADQLDCLEVPVKDDDLTREFAGVIQMLE